MSESRANNAAAHDLVIIPKKYSRQTQYNLS